MLKKINLLILLLFCTSSISVFAAKIVPLKELRKPETIAVETAKSILPKVLQFTSIH